MRNLCCARERIQFRQEIHINTCKTNASRVRTAKRLRQTLPIFSRIQWTTCSVLNKEKLFSISGQHCNVWKILWMFSEKYRCYLLGNTCGDTQSWTANENMSIKTVFFRMVQWHFWGLAVGKKFKCHVWPLELFQSILVPVFVSSKCK